VGQQCLAFFCRLSDRYVSSLTFINRRDDCAEPLFATDALSRVAYQWIRSTDKVFVADKGASKGAAVFVNVRLNLESPTTFVVKQGKQQVKKT